MIKCVSMSVDASGNILTQKSGIVVMLAATQRYRAIKKKGGFTTASRVAVSNTTTYALDTDGKVNRLKGRVWEKLPGRLSTSLSVNENDELFIVDAGSIYKMPGDA